MKKSIIVTIIIIALIGAGVSYQFLFREKEANFSVGEAEISNITEKVSVTGSLVPLQRIELEPKTKEEVKEVLVEVSDKVEEDQLLIQLDQEGALIQLEKSRSNLNSTRQEIELLNTKLANTKQELERTKETMASNIEKAKSEVESAEITLNSKKQNLEDVKEEANSDLDQVYEDARNTLGTEYLVSKKAFLEVESIQESYFTANNQISLTVKDKVDSAEEKLDVADEFIDTANETESTNDTNEAIEKLKEALNSVKEALRYTRDVACEDASYKNTVSSTDKSTLDTQKSNVETSISDVVSAKQDIASEEIDKQKSINDAQALVDSAQASLNTSKRSLDQVKAQKEEKITQINSQTEQIKTEVKLKESKVDSAKADLNEARKKLEDTKIKAPVAGTITKVEIEEGETAKPGNVIIAMIPEKKYKIEADVSEVNIASIDKNDPVKVDFDAFPNENYNGTVHKIHPAEIVKEGVIYYRIEVLLTESPDKLKPGFTTNLDIITGQKENVVAVPYVAVKEDEQGKYVEIAEDHTIKEKRRVKTGLEGDTMIEIKEGLKKGEKVVLYKED